MRDKRGNKMCSDMCNKSAIKGDYNRDNNKGEKGN